MVKKFITGLLKKKDKGDTKEPEDVPEELPPLAEDVVEKAEKKPKEDAVEEKAPEIKGDILTEQIEPPSELPSLDDVGIEEKHPDIHLDSGLVEDSTDSDDHELPDEIRRAKAAKAGKVTIPGKKEDEIDHDSDIETLKEKIKTEHEVGFFSSILEYMGKNEGHKDKLLAGDLFARMNNYWELKKHEIKTGATVSTEEKLEGDLKIQLEQLKILEQKWQVQKLALGEDLKFLHEREREIQSKVEEMKRISNELNLFKDLKPEEYFYIYNGVVLKNLHDLIDVLEIIDDETFNHHVNKEKNDFSEWIKSVIKDKSLAEKIKKSGTKEGMIEILETEPVIMGGLKNIYKSRLPPKKYFWLKNGVVIKSLYQLSDALKAMDDELFENHANEDKNDFSAWVKNTLKDEELAQKLQRARTRKDMADILSVYL